MGLLVIRTGICHHDRSNVRPASIISDGHCGDHLPYLHDLDTQFGLLEACEVPVIRFSPLQQLRRCADIKESCTSQKGRTSIDLGYSTTRLTDVAIRASLTTYPHSIWLRIEADTGRIAYSGLCCACFSRTRLPTEVFETWHAMNRAYALPKLSPGTAPPPLCS